MLATLKFNLPEEQLEFDCAIAGADYKAVLEELNQKLRNEVKYGNDFSAEQREAFAKVREWVFQLLEEFNVRLD